MKPPTNFTPQQCDCQKHGEPFEDCSEHGMKNPTPQPIEQAHVFHGVNLCKCTRICLGHDDTKRELEELLAQAILQERERIKGLVGVSLKLMEKEKTVYPGMSKDMLDLIDLPREESTK